MAGRSRAVTREPTLADLTDPAPDPGPDDWNADGLVILPSFMPHGLIGRYCVRWIQENTRNRIASAHFRSAQQIRWGGWPDCTPYMRHKELRDLFCYRPLADELENLTGEAMGVHLNLTGWVTTARDWHQDQYLNEPGVDDAYAAVWIALGDIHPDSGPFQYVPGSHRWPQVDRQKLRAALRDDELGPDWPRHSERILTPLFTREIEKRHAQVVTHLPKLGDVLIWHPRLLHRGSVAKQPGMERRAAIAHYSGIVTRGRIDMPNYRRHNGGGFYFILNGGPV